MPTTVKKKETEAEVLKIEKAEQLYHPVETFSEMSKNISRTSEGAFSTPGEADFGLRVARNADELRKYQTPLANRLLYLLRSL